jgi:Seryl-tRNA synthetase
LERYHHLILIQKPIGHLVKILKILDFERASKITGARFPLYLRQGARMERALIQFMLDIHTNEHGYIETLPHLLCQEKKKGLIEVKSFVNAYEVKDAIIQAAKYDKKN